jgi:hypothetical protein
MRLKARSPSVRLAGALACGAALLLGASAAQAADAGPPERQLTPEEIDAWLDSRAMPKSQSDRSADDDADVPPPLPRKKGFVIESSIGVFGQLGALKNITPNAPWFGLRFGYEPLRWLMAFAETDLFVANTGYAHPPPPPRAYSFWNVGGGVRFTVRPHERFGVYVQGSVGGGRATQDVLDIYGYPNANKFGLYVGGELGFEWYQINPHLALALHGGVRDYPSVLKRERDSSAALGWLSGAALRYTF